MKAVCAAGAAAGLALAFPPAPIALQFSKSFGAATIAVSGTTTLTFTVTNANASSISGLAFSDVLPAGLQIAVPLVVTNTCGGVVTTSVNAIGLANGVVPASSSCSVQVNVLGIATGTQVNTTSTLSSQIGTSAASTATLVVGANFLIRYASNLDQGDAVVNISNTGVNGALLFGPGFGGAAGNLCVNLYAFSPDEQLVSCCSCLVTPNALVSLSVANDLLFNTLTGLRPNSVVIKLLATGTGGTVNAPSFSGASCSNSAALLAAPLALDGITAWGTTIHAVRKLTETPFLPASLTAAELASISNRCTNIIGNGSSFGICRSCRAGGLGADKL